MSLTQRRVITLHFFHALCECWMDTISTRLFPTAKGFISWCEVVVCWLIEIHVGSLGVPDKQQQYRSRISRGVEQAGRNFPSASGFKTCQASGISWKHEICQRWMLTPTHSVSSPLVGSLMYSCFVKRKLKLQQNIFKTFSALKQF